MSKYKIFLLVMVVGGFLFGVGGVMFALSKQAYPNSHNPVRERYLHKLNCERIYDECIKSWSFHGEKDGR